MHGPLLGEARASRSLPSTKSGESVKYMAPVHIFYIRVSGGHWAVDFILAHILYCFVTRSHSWIWSNIQGHGMAFGTGFCVRTRGYWFGWSGSSAQQDATPEML
jgi:hypothetical protein